MMVEKIPLRKTIARLDFPAIIAIGNPLLDILVILKNDELIKKHNLKIDGETELCEKKLQELITDLPPEIEQYTNPGGSAQNTSRILQWLCDETHESQISIFCGCLGNDQRGSILEKLVRLAGVDARYAVHPTLPTGLCVSLIYDKSRSLVANIGAASVYTLDDLKKANLQLDSIKIIYIEGYFVTHSLDVAKELVKRAQEKNIIVAFNLNSLYIFQDHQAAICEMVGHAKIVFGNVREMIALAQALNVKYDDVADIPFLLNSLKRITMDVSSANSKDWLADDGIFIMTRGGCGPAIIVWGRGQSVQVQPIVPKTPIVDTTGAGDALAAGFLAGVLAHWDPKSCLELGCKVASCMITRLGVSLPSDMPPDFLP
ncbi:PREDICTED: adenosine kinase-like isoform X2 [Trachymyrmex septentrionalis]|uniref:adenosine kinase-like isoform X2 n=1 Tax=Trachymyrmex septentrionalis TaxID=34720 RepID=UPI00084F02BA|nr:PREDICTED: adenosine kinase-like isoform X2 [Trachymyrmex septentrionalis]